MADKTLKFNIIVTINEANKQITELQKKLVNLKTQMNGLDTNSKQWNNLNKQFVQTTNQVNQLSASTQRLQTNLDSLNGTAQKTGSMFMNITRYFTGFLLVSQVSKGIRQATKDYVQFSNTLATNRALMGGSKDDLEALRKQALELGRTTIFTSLQVADLQTNLIKLGVEGTANIGMLTSAITTLAAASDEDLAKSGDVLVSLLNQFQLGFSEAGNVVNTMTQTFIRSASDLDSYANSMKYVGTTANQLGLKIEEVSSLIAMLSQINIKGSSAGTSLNNMLIEMAKSSGDVAKKTGITVKSYEDVIKVFKSLNEQGVTVTEMFDMLNIRGAKAALSFIDPKQLENLDIMLKSLTDVKMTAEEIADIQLDSLAGDVKKLGSNWQALTLEIQGAADKGIRSLVQSLGGLVDNLRAVFNWLSAHDKVTKVLFQTMKTLALWFVGKWIATGEQIKQTWTKVATSIKNYRDNIKLATWETEAYKKTQLGTNVIINQTKIAFIGLGQVIKGIGVGLKAMVASNPIGTILIAIQGAIKLFKVWETTLASANYKAKKAYRDAKKEIEGEQGLLAKEIISNQKDIQVQLNKLRAEGMTPEEFIGLSPEQLKEYDQDLVAMISNLYDEQLKLQSEYNDEHAKLLLEKLDADKKNTESTLNQLKKLEQAQQTPGYNPQGTNLGRQYGPEIYRQPTTSPETGAILQPQTIQSNEDYINLVKAKYKQEQLEIEKNSMTILTMENRLTDEQLKRLKERNKLSSNLTTQGQEDKIDIIKQANLDLLKLEQNAIRAEQRYLANKKEIELIQDVYDTRKLYIEKTQELLSIELKIGTEEYAKQAQKIQEEYDKMYASDIIRYRRYNELKLKEDEKRIRDLTNLQQTELERKAIEIDNAFGQIDTDKIINEISDVYNAFAQLTNLDKMNIAGSFAITEKELLIQLENIKNESKLTFERLQEDILISGTRMINELENEYQDNRNELRINFETTVDLINQETILKKEQLTEEARIVKEMIDTQVKDKKEASDKKFQIEKELQKNINALNVSQQEKITGKGGLEEQFQQKGTELKTNKETQINKIQLEYIGFYIPGIGEVKGSKVLELINTTNKQLEVAVKNTNMKIGQNTIETARYIDEILQGYYQRIEELDVTNKPSFKNKDKQLQGNKSDELTESKKRFDEELKKIGTDNVKKVKLEELYQIERNAIIKKFQNERLQLILSEASQYVDAFSQTVAQMGEIWAIQRQLEEEQIEASYQKQIEKSDDRYDYLLTEYGLKNKKEADMTAAQQRKLEQLTAKHDEELKKAEEDKEANMLATKKKYADKEFAIQVAGIIASTAQGVMGIWAKWAWMPILAAGMTVATLAVGATQVMAAKKQRDATRQLEFGGEVEGPSHKQGGVPAIVGGSTPVELEGGEIVVNKRASSIPWVKDMALKLNSINNPKVKSNGRMFESGGMVKTPIVNNNQVNIDRNTLTTIVEETVKGISAIPVVNNVNDTTRVKNNQDRIIKNTTW